MRRIVLIAAAIIIVALIVAFYPTYVEKPVKDGEGPMAVYLHPDLPAPETHNPLEWWQTHHMNVVNYGDLTRTDCLYCHDPQTSCNNCHDYVGVSRIVASEWVRE